MSASVFRLAGICICLWICLALTACAASEDPALADELDLAAFAGRVELCEWPLVEYNSTCTCDVGWTWHNQTCAACAVGFYKDTAGAHACLACPPFTTSFEGAEESSQCLCVSGYHNESASCVPCARASYKPYIGNNTCLECPAHSNTLSTAASTLSECLCVPGYTTSSSNELCVACPQHTYSTTMGETCTACPAHSGTVASASTDCQCDAGFENSTVLHACAACAEGKYKADRETMTCSDCPERMSSAPAATSLNNCTCNAGYQKLTENTCQLCALNFYCAGADAVVSCPGNSTSTRGASVIDACTCIDGFFWWNNMCVLCSADYFCSNNTRIPCDANSTSLTIEGFDN